MKRLFPTSLALLLVMSSLGHVLAAAFCPRVLGRECCFAKTPGHTHAPASSHEDMEVHGMPMDGMTMDGMGTDDMAMNDMAMDDPTAVDVSTPFSQPVVFEEAVTDKFEQPIESCTHCLSHSGILNAPVSSVTAADQSKKDVGSVLLSVPRFMARPAMTLAQSGLPREHAPPGTSAPRHILISVFLI